MKVVRISCKGEIELPLKEFTLLQGNLKTLSTENYEKLKSRILQRGFSFPIFIWPNEGTNFILDGHHRVMVMRKLEEEGYVIPPIPACRIEAENIGEAKLKLLECDSNYAKVNADGYLEFTAEIDMSEAKNQIDIPDFDMGLLDIEAEILPPSEKDDHVPGVKHDPVTKRGDVWLLGDHRVMCGDSTMIDDVERLMQGEKADMVFTDPPYGMDLDTDYSKCLPSKNSKRNIKSGNTYDKVLGDSEYFDPTFLFEILSPKEMFLWGADYYCWSLPSGGSWVVWDKTGGNDSLMDAGFASNFELCWSMVKHKRDIARVTYKGVAGMKPEDGKRVHPTQKPVGICEWFINKWGKDYNVIDLFLGSGSTLIACEKTKRKCYGLELDEHYCDVVIERFEKFSGKKAKLESTGATYEELKAVKEESMPRSC